MWGQVLGSAIGSGLGYIGGRQANRMSNDQFNQNLNMQREFAMKGIRWKVEDAKAAGLHPLYALGGAGSTFSPASSSFTNPMASLESAGQNIGRAIDATRTSSERREHERDLRLMERERYAAEIRLLNAQAGAANRSNQPPMPEITADPSKPEEVVGRSNPASGRLPENTGEPWLRISPGMSAEDFEQEYGEVGGSLYGLGKAAWDFGRTGYDRYAPKALPSWIQRKKTSKKYRHPFHDLHARRRSVY